MNEQICIYVYSMYVCLDIIIIVSYLSNIYINFLMCKTFLSNMILCYYHHYFLINTTCSSNFITRPVVIIASLYVMMYVCTTTLFFMVHIYTNSVWRWRNDNKNNNNNTLIQWSPLKVWFDNTAQYQASVYFFSIDSIFLYMEFSLWS